MTDKILRWRPGHTLKPSDMPRFEEAAIVATQMALGAWTRWLNRTKGYKYSFVCKMAKEVGLCLPGPAFYPKMRIHGLKLLKERDSRPHNQENDDDLLWSQG